MKLPVRRIALVLLWCLYSHLSTSLPAEAFLFQRLRPVATSKLSAAPLSLYHHDTASHNAANQTSSPSSSSSYQIVNAHQDNGQAAAGGFVGAGSSRTQQPNESVEEEEESIDGCPSVCQCNRAAQIADCSHRNLNRVPTGFPADIRRIRLERNNITELGPHAFAGLKRLQRIDLSNNNLVKIDPLAFAGGLQSLSSLILYSNKLSQLPGNVFSELSQLQLLLLNANSLHCISRELFQPLANLNLLSLYDNNIETITNGTFDGLKNIRTIHLAKNPLICDCNLRWLANYLELNPIETSDARCEAPRRNHASKLSQLSKQRFRCEANEEARSSQLAVQCQAKVSNPNPSPSLSSSGSEAEPHQEAGPTSAGTDLCPAGCVCDGSTVDCSRVSQSKSRPSPTAGGLYEIPDVPDDIPVYVTRMRINDSRIKRFRQTNLFRRLANSHKLDLGNNRIIDIEDNAINGGAPSANNGSNKPDRIIFVLVENEHCSTAAGPDSRGPTRPPTGSGLPSSPEDGCSSAPRVNAPDFNSPCYNGGSCISGSAPLPGLAKPQQVGLLLLGASNYSCICPPGFTGPLCEINIDDCIEHQCQNGAMCVDLVNSYKCVCRDPTTSGEFCEQFNSVSTSNLIGAPMALPIVAPVASHRLNAAPESFSSPAINTQHQQQQLQTRSTDLMRPPVELGGSSCKRITQRNHYYDGKGCRSARMLKISECSGACGGSANQPGDSSCCLPAKVKRRKVRMQCSDGASYVKTIDLIKKCACSSGEQCSAQLAANFYNATSNEEQLLQTTRLVESVE